MNKKLGLLSFALACLLGTSASAIAGGLGEDAGSLKDSIYAGVPVPAPSPIPMYSAEWYVRADFGYSLSTDSGASSSGPGFTTFGDGLDGPAMLSLGFGRYITPNIRAEFSLDLRNDYKVGPNEQSYSGVVTEAATSVLNGGPGGTNRHYYDVTRNDEVRIGNYTGLVNLYYDFRNHTRFTPYVGGGAGIVIHTLKRAHRESAVCNHSTNDTTGTEINYQASLADTTPVCASAGTLPGGDTEANSTDTNTFPSQSDNVETGYGFAASLMAGVAVEIGHDMLLDLSYRYMWMGGDVKIIAPTLDHTNTVSIGDITEHQLRVGVRWNIN